MRLAQPVSSADIDPTHRDAAQLLKIQQLAESPHKSVAPSTDLAAPVIVAPSTPPPASKAPSVAKSAPPPAAKKVASARPEPVKVRDAKPEASKNKGRQIRSVAVPLVSGAPGRGNDELTAAMREVLKKAGWPVRTNPASDALTIRGKVEVGQSANGQQKIVLAWELVDPEGSVLGTIRQANNVPAGSIDAGFGPNAQYAAQAAASGIFDLIAKVKRRQG